MRAAGDSSDAASVIVAICSSVNAIMLSPSSAISRTACTRTPDGGRRELPFTGTLSRTHRRNTVRLRPSRHSSIAEKTFAPR